MARRFTHAVGRRTHRKRLTKAERSAIARRAAAVRWAKKRGV